MIPHAANTLVTLTNNKDIFYGLLMVDFSTMLFGAIPLQCYVVRDSFWAECVSRLAQYQNWSAQLISWLTAKFFHI